MSISTMFRVTARRGFGSLALSSLSRVKGPSEPALVSLTLGGLLKQTCADHGQKPAVISMHQNKQITYNELDKLSDNLASNLSSVVTKGDKVAVCCGNRYEFLVIQMGLAKLGVVLVPLNTAFTPDQFKAALDHCGAKALITQTKLEKRNNKSVDFTPIIEYGQQQKIKVYEIGGSFDQLMQDAPQIPETTVADEVINMQFTSGTTSTPKLTALTHTNIVNNGRFIGHRMGLTATAANHPTGQDRLCIPVPMFHCFGLVLANLAAVSHGAALVYPSESFDPVKSLQAVKEFGCTGLYGVPTMFAQQLELVNGEGANLSKGIAAGSAIPIEMMNRLIDTMNLSELAICYGMTETSPVSFMTSPIDSVEKRTRTVGKVMPHTEAMIVDPTCPSMDPVPIGTRGEIYVSGYLLQKEYHNDHKATSEAMVHDLCGKRWMKTGDEGFIDEDGYLTVTGRIKDLIIRGGENIHPLEIENALFTHSDVSQASVVGIPCDKYGEQIVAFIVPHNNAKINQQQLRDHVCQKIGPFLAPEHFLIVEDFPKTASGKIRKVELRGIATDKICKST